MENENCQCIENQIKEDMVQILEKYTTDRDNLIQILNRELKPDYYVCGEHSDGKPKFLTTGTKSWNITEYKYIDPDNGNIIEKPKKELDNM